MTELKPCPFCGNDGSGDHPLERYADASSVVCEKCGTFGPDVDDPQSAIEAWNSRASLAEQPQPPADGEAGELVLSEIARNLRTKAATEKANACHYSAALLTRAADLLERQQPQEGTP